MKRPPQVRIPERLYSRLGHLAMVRGVTVVSLVEDAVADLLFANPVSDTAVLSAALGRFKNPPQRKPKRK